MDQSDKFDKWRALEPHMRYITDFMLMICKRDDQALWVQEMIAKRKGAIRHLIDSMAAVYAIRKIKKEHHDFDFNDMVIFSVADGHKPYTAAVLSIFFPKTEIHAIDPDMRLNNRTHLICNNNDIYLHKKKVEEVNIDTDKRIRVLVSVHGHGPISEYYMSLPSPKYFVSIPCCKDYGVLKDRVPDIEYIDPCIVCKCNKILIYIDMYT